MSLRRSGLLPLAVAVAVAGCKDVSKTSPPPPPSTLAVRRPCDR